MPAFRPTYQTVSEPRSLPPIDPARMKRMWSPWRSRHIERMSNRDPREPDDGSIFTRMAAEKRDEENFILWRGEHVFVIMNLYPYNNGHLMIVPYREVSEYGALTSEERNAIAETIARCMQWIDRALKPEGYNVGINQGVAAGAGIPQHLHVHVVPRWQADTNFMPVVADVKVIPEAMRDTYRKLRAAIDALE